MKGITLLHGHFLVEICKHLLDLLRNDCEKSNYRSLAGIGPSVAFFAAVPGWLKIYI